MNTITGIPRANKARLDNRWGCSVGQAFRNFNPSSRLDAQPAPAVPALERSPNSTRHMPLEAANFQVTGGSFYAHLFENRTLGLPRDLYWSSTIQFAPIDYIGESWEPTLTIEWLALGARRFTGTHPASPQCFPLGEASLYLAEHHPVADWRCTWAWDGESPLCHLSFDAALDFPGLDNYPVRGLRLSGSADLTFDGFIVVRDNLTPKPSSLEEAAGIIGQYFDEPLSGTDEGWRYTFAP